MRRILPCLTLVLALTGCSGMKDLFSAHANVAAEAAGHTLTADSLASLMLEAKGARLTPETAEFIANVPVIYKIHLFFGMTLFVLFPFSRLVHVWSGFASVSYMTRAWQLVRPRG